LDLIALVLSLLAEEILNVNKIGYSELKEKFSYYQTRLHQSLGSNVCLFFLEANFIPFLRS